MIYRDFKGEKLSLLGFGAMRLPTLEDGSIDQELTNDMFDYALDHGVNYFDTAFPYHNSMSEIAVGNALSRHPRDSYDLATKFPGHVVAKSFDPEGVFELQLKKCGVDYFDFYLMHNVYEFSIKNYLDERWGIMDYFIEQKKRGRIRHLGFSCHGDIPIIEEFLDRYGDELEFCQIQLNYLDWTLQNAKGKYETLEKRGYPVWVMEPVRGGRLADLPEQDKKKLAAMREGASEA
ncbi:MAG: aldo/keto reductase, partial [Anaerovoracaceae bacterium]|nr:aldo/keto reductase [Anaerovoracaceae bacterium]